MKRCIALLLTVVMAVTMLAGCGKSTPNVLADKSLEDILNAVYEEKIPEFPLMSTPVDMADENSVKYFTGLSKEDGAKVKEALASESAMGSQAYSLVLMRLNDANDAQAVADAVKAGIDTRKWICVEADDMRVVASGDVVMLIMVSTVFAENITADQVAEAFAKVAGGTLTVE